MAYYRSPHEPSTPPNEDFYERGHSRHVSSSSSYSNRSSPAYAHHSLPTPIKSPVRQVGPVLLPRIRSQDQHVEPAPPPMRRHRKALSATQNLPASMVYSRPSAVRRSTSPYAGTCPDLVSPVSTRSGHSRRSSNLSSPITLTPSHSRNSSGSGINEQVLEKFGYPTYRELPKYMTPMYVPGFLPGASTFVPQPTYYAPDTSYFHQDENSLPSYLQYTDAETTTTTLLDFLTSPNPSPELVSHINFNYGRGSNSPHFWWDIRNLRSWTDFSLKTMNSMPQFRDLLRCQVNSDSLPVPSYNRACLRPENEASLHDLCRDFYADKVNHALAVTLGKRHMAMRPKGQSQREPRPPHFVSNYIDDMEKSLSGQPRGRVVGLVKSFDRWNTGMRAEAPHKKVEYLLGLAHLHRHMREHSCRYGFIITEIELVCVRAGVESIPNFGLLELSPAIQLNAHGVDAFTAPLALWYLHMLAKEQPLPGQPGWHIDVGGPALLTRKKCLEKDSWIPTPSVAEKREAKRVRGWVLNTDEINRKELPNRRRASVQIR
ncbi:MAG: hypothetical protein M4579_002106 [Chaenotheca gracillima]|nr:MAG: hypothetical protein M4579_002106 [Chaenotheca gracillima]